MSTQERVRFSISNPDRPKKETLTTADLGVDFVAMPVKGPAHKLALINQSIQIMGELAAKAEKEEALKS
ncbi:hypothetical protein [Neptunomonas japonica]|uniref:hypothetical protein n=1 Tax=Neptunomonas japonica TaxID=417574 RepID=UPI0003F71ECA|nr:hypothetical protein [Neptunomonas japonica]